jgi:hypothetical protein
MSSWLASSLLVTGIAGVVFERVGMATGYVSSRLALARRFASSARVGGDSRTDVPQRAPGRPGRRKSEMRDCVCHPRLEMHRVHGDEEVGRPVFSRVQMYEPLVAAVVGRQEPLAVDRPLAVVEPRSVEDARRPPAFSERSGIASGA